jgi:serine/threonine-protein kinase
VVTYQLISGRLPYAASSLSELALKQQRERPIPLDELIPEVPPELAQAVAGALSIDSVDRPTEAMQLAAELRDGVRGIAPQHTGDLATSATRVGRPPTTATRVGRPEPAVTRAEAQRVAPPRQVPAGRAPRPSEAARRAHETASRPPARRRTGMRRFMAFLSLLVVVAIIAVAAILISNSTASKTVHFKKVVAHDTRGAIDQLRSLIDKYTK